VRVAVWPSLKEWPAPSSEIFEEGGLKIFQSSFSFVIFSVVERKIGTRRLP